MLPFLEAAGRDVTFDPTLGLTLRQQLERFLPTVGFELGTGRKGQPGTAKRIALKTSRAIDRELRKGRFAEIPSFIQGEIPEGLVGLLGVGQAALSPTEITELQGLTPAQQVARVVALIARGVNP